MEIKKVAVISDTHDMLREQVLEIIKECDLIFHAGDFSSNHIYDSLRALKPMYAVRGNTDAYWNNDLPLVSRFEILGKEICICHKKSDIHYDMGDFDLVVTGHTHKYHEAYEGKTLFLNPGSCGPVRMTLPVTMALLYISQEEIEVERIEIESDWGSLAIEEELQLRPLIEKVIKSVKKGRSVEEISEKYKADPKLVEKIVRLYLTHPGVDPDGIMTKMGI
ncbi:MAG: YfcE family phosphodiesterase [Lachnospiraceae bacterium]|nr:YfcE family phosphodiesterase [Lachnospiraceae bacterium]